MAMRPEARSDAREEGLPTPWLAARLGVQPTHLDLKRRAGELIAVRQPGSQEYVYPAWQFGPGFQPRPIVPRLVKTARERGIDERRLCELLEMRLGLTGSRRLVDLLRDGEDERVLTAIRSAAP